MLYPIAILKGDDKTAHGIFFLMCQILPVRAMTCKTYTKWR